jgi:hypothetical protein
MQEVENSIQISLRLNIYLQSLYPWHHWVRRTSLTMLKTQSIVLCYNSDILSQIARPDEAVAGLEETVDLATEPPRRLRVHCWERREFRDRAPFLGYPVALVLSLLSD